MPTAASSFTGKESPPNTYFERQFNCQAVKVLPGDYHVTSTGSLVVTILGSCVAACLRDPQLGIAGMNHFLLPSSNSSSEDSARYGAYAMEILINDMLKQGCRRNRLEAKIFGGGNVLRAITSQQVGQKNVDFVKQYLMQEKIPIVAEDLLSSLPRKVFFFTDTGKVLVKKLKPQQESSVIQRERQYLDQINASHPSGEVELFD